MIPELFAMADDRKFCIPGGLDVSSPSSLSSSSSSTMSNSSSTPSEAQQNLRCPRCDSPNTKFCYYNNYNLTQPRHFCKTCRRYWTKGGALRNVPIGGGCRKVKPSPALAAACRSGSMRAKPATSFANDVAARPGNGGFFENHELPSSPVLWGASPYNSQLLDLLRASQFLNPNASPATTLNLNYMRIKEDGGAMIGSNQTTEPVYSMGEQGLGLDSLDQLTVLPCNWRNGPHYQYHQQQQPQQQLQLQQQQHNILLGEMQNSGIQELLQRLRSSANYSVGNQLQTVSSNVCSAASHSSTAVTTSLFATSTANSILEPLPPSGADAGGYWNPAPISWVDLSSANGAFP